MSVLAVLTLIPDLILTLVPVVCVPQVMEATIIPMDMAVEVLACTEDTAVDVIPEVGMALVGATWAGVVLPSVDLSILWAAA